MVGENQGINMHSLNIFKNVKTNTPEITTIFNTPMEMMDWFEENLSHDEAVNKDGPAIGYFNLNKEGTRQKKNIITVSCIVLDVDECTEAQMESATDTLTNLNYIIHSTFSYSAEKPKYRLILILKTPVTAAQYEEKKLASCLATKLNLTIDSVSDVPNQIFYAPTHPIGDVAFALHVNRGEKFLSADDLSDYAKTSGSKKSSSSMNDGEEISIAEANTVVKDVFNGNLIFCEGNFWRYSSGCWRKFNEQEVLKYLTTTAFENRKSLVALRSIVGTLKVIQYELEFPKFVGGEDIVVMNDVSVHPTTLEVIAHSPSNYARNILPYNYDANAECPLWEQFLSSCWKSDLDQNEKIQLLQEFVGYCFVKSVKFGKMLWLIGSGANGKSVILNTVLELIGAVNSSAVSMTKMGDRFQTVQMLNKMVNIDSEMSATEVIADSVLKAIITGDTITIEGKGTNTYSTKLSIKLLAATNNMPKTKDYSHGFFRRILPLTFNNIVPEGEQDRELPDKLKGELSGIFNWAMLGLDRLLKNDRFTVPESAVETLAQYHVTSNSAAVFFAQHLRVLPIDATPRMGMITYDVYENYRNFCLKNGYVSMNSAEFGKRLKELAVVKRKSNDHGYYMVSMHGMEIYSSSLNTVSPILTKPFTSKDIDDEFSLH